MFLKFFQLLQLLLMGLTLLLYQSLKSLFLVLELALEHFFKLLNRLVYQSLIELSCCRGTVKRLSLLKRNDWNGLLMFYLNSLHFCNLWGARRKRWHISKRSESFWRHKILWFILLNLVVVWCVLISLAQRWPSSPWSYRWIVQFILNYILRRR